MIDVHCHILPDVDDGCVGEESLAMLDECVKNGAKDIFCTPHFRSPYLAEKEVICNKFHVFYDKAKAVYPDVNLYQGQEIRYSPETLKALLDGRLLTMNSTKCVLLEFDFFEFEDISEICYTFTLKGYIPIVAHVERYFYVDSLDKVEEIKASGALIQINSDSVTGFNGKGCKKFVYKLIKEGLVDFVASDYHFCRTNTFKLAYDKINKKFGKQAAEALFYENPKIMIYGKNIKL